MNPADEDVPKSLDIIAKYVSSSPIEKPARFVLELAHCWKEKGSTLAGKPRHSDRYLDDLLRLRGTPVKSLVPKLAGRTHLKPSDASVLVGLFLSHWEYTGDPNSGEIRGRSSDLYRPLLPEWDIEVVCRYLEQRIATVGADTKNGGESASRSSDTDQYTNDLIAAEFQKCTAWFTIGAGQTVLNRPEWVLIGFRNLLNRLWSIEKADNQDRILIWALDLGRQDFDDPESRLRFMNVEALISRFKALRRFKESSTEARWNWLQSKTIVVVHDTRSVRPEVPRLPAFDPNHVLFSAIPPRWAGSPEFLSLYGHERLHETNYSIFLSETTDDQTSLQSSHRNYEFRYFGHAMLGAGDQDDHQLRGLRLNAPGRSYVEALGTVFLAASQKLGVQNVPAQIAINGMNVDSAHAIEKLRHHGFLLLRLNEFIAF